MKTRKILAASAVMMVGIAGLSACGGGSDDGASSDGSVSMTFWHNSTTGDGKAYWEDTVAGVREGQPGRHDRDPGHPERGHGRQAADRPELRRRARHLHGARRRQARRRRRRPARRMDLTDQHRPTPPRPRSATASFSAFDDRRQGLRHADCRCCPAASTTARTCSTQAGITETPDHDRRARGGRRRSSRPPASRRSPSARKDAWPAAHWYYFFALRECSQDTMDEAADRQDFDDPCWLDGRRGPAGVRRDRAVQRGLPHHHRPAGRRLVRGPARQPPGRHGAHGRLGARRDRLADPRREAAGGPRLVPLPGGRRWRGR